MNIHFKQITIVGVGLIGGSFARACKKRAIADKIVGYGRGEANLKKGVELGVIDSYSLDLQEAVADSDFILLAPPVKAIISLAKEMATHLKPGAIVTDAGSVKGKIVQHLEEIFSSIKICFIGSHPIAGTEKGGVEASFDSLFEGAKCIITPSRKSDQVALDTVKQLWSKLGSLTIEMGWDEHDIIMGGVSHLPHVAAYALVNAVYQLNSEDRNMLQFSAGGFKDITRIASSSPALWVEICLMNRETLIPLIKKLKHGLEDIEKCIDKRNGDELEKIFCNAKDFRDRI